MSIAREKSGKLQIAIIISVVLALILGAGAFTFTKIVKKPSAKAHKEKPVELSEWTLPEFIVNLADTDEPRYLKVDVVLEVDRKSKKGEKEGSSEEAKARDAIITVLSRKHFSELLTESGKTRLKSELKKALNSRLKDIEVVNVYFTSFAMQ